MNENGWYAKTGIIVGSIAGFVTFFSVWIAAVGSVGWVIGIALGWIPALLASLIAYVVGAFLWPLAALAILVVIAAFAGWL
jgi:hypothetical protein